MDSEWKKLFDRVQVAIGMGDEDYTEPKVKLNYDNKPRGIEPGATVQIKWKPYEGEEDEGFEQEDIGYLFVMPSTENDPLMGGIVHIPLPIGGEKCQCEPEWQTLYDLERNEMIESITIPAFRLPEGKTCKDCNYWKRCKSLICSLTGEEDHCDFTPSRFRVKAD